MQNWLRMLTVGLLFWGTSANADPLDLVKYKGKVVYLDFWASWCTPCHLSFPWMNQVLQMYGREGLAIVAVDVDRDRAAADSFLASNKGQLDVVYDPDGSVARQFHVQGMPTAVLIGRDGKVHSVHSGFETSKESSYLTDVLTLLNQKGQ
jgi:thiol-disulfide isomerase/thioredoxin